MTDDRLAEIIRELRRELEAADRAIVVLERIAGVPPKRGRPRKTPALMRTAARLRASPWPGKQHGVTGRH